MSYSDGPRSLAVVGIPECLEQMDLNNWNSLLKGFVSCSNSKHCIYDETESEFHSRCLLDGRDRYHLLGHSHNPDLAAMELAYAGHLRTSEHRPVSSVWPPIA